MHVVSSKSPKESLKSPKNTRRDVHHDVHLKMRQVKLKDVTSLVQVSIDTESEFRLLDPIALVAPVNRYVPIPPSQSS